MWSVFSIVWENRRGSLLRWRFPREEDRVYRAQSGKSDFALQFSTYGTKGNLLLVSREPLTVNLQNSFSIYQWREHCDLRGKLVFFHFYRGTVACSYYSYLLLKSLSLLQTLWFVCVFNVNFSCRVAERDEHLDGNLSNPKYMYPPLSNTPVVTSKRSSTPFASAKRRRIELDNSLSAFGESS